MSRRPKVQLQVKNFAQIRAAELEFGDLTVLVGPQGTGKSLLLQLFKLLLDSGEVFAALRDAGHALDAPDDFLDLYFGQGMRRAWRQDTSVVAKGLAGKAIDLGKIPRTKPDGKARVFYIPAHRALLLADGWPAPFLKLSADTPTVARLFSQNLFALLGDPKSPDLFPVPRILKEEYRAAIDEAVYHGGRVRLDKAGLRKRLELQFGAETRLPFMTWTAGQREFTPLLLGLYHLLPSQARPKQPDIEWVIIEEPEVGLHPRAIAVVMLLVLDLLWRGYRVILSTHSPLILDVVFALRTLQAWQSGPETLYRAFGVRKTQKMREVMKAALQKSYRSYFLDFVDGEVVSRDISALDPGADDPAEAGWGGLTAFSSGFNEAIARASRGKG